jgi:4'-phosphopantetheinyl transferase EntD
VSGLLASLLPSGVFGAEIFDHGQVVPLSPDEEALVAGSSDKRRRDFALGRACARAALEQLGLPGAVGRQAHGAPVWPSGVTGSITHTNGYAAAIVARQPDFTGLGVDAERVGRVDKALWPRLFDAQERAWLEAQSDAAEMAVLLFAAKEAAFKAANPQAGQALQFQTLHIEVTGATTFRIHGRDGEGRYAVREGLVLACVFAR